MASIIPVSWRGRRMWAIGASILALLLLILMPMRAALSMGASERQSAVTARATGGTIWSGQIADLQLAGMALGDVNAGLSLWPLFLGRIEFGIKRDAANGQSGLNAILLSGLGGKGIRALNGDVPTAANLGNIPISSLRFENFNVRFDSSGCREAGGNVRLYLDGSVLGVLNIDNGLLGRARCDGKALLLPMLSQSTMEKVDLRIFSEGKYEATITVMNDDPAVSTMLGLAGFVPISGGYAMKRTGKF